MSAQTRFSRKPTRWVATQVGSALLMAFMKLHPVQRALTRLEIRNILDYWNNPEAPYPFAKPRWYSYNPLDWVKVGVLCYLASIRRVVQLGRQARQDYFALNRYGCFVAQSLPRAEAATGPQASTALNKTLTPLIIVPGLNTPAVFFREMHRYFTHRGMPVSVLELPNKGLSDVATAAQALDDEVERLKTSFNTPQVNVVGHCLGGLISHYYLSSRAQADRLADVPPPIGRLITLSTGFMGCDGVRILKEVWMQNHPTTAVPRVFDELIEWNRSMVNSLGRVVCHNFVTVWDFIVHFQQAMLRLEHTLDASDVPSPQVVNHLIEDSAVDHLTIALHPAMLRKIEQALTA
ncbi:MAG: alpha/beta fold hydrolase [Vampirovibrionales bacterium]